MRRDSPDDRSVVLWAAECAEHVIGHFEQIRPTDDRPRRAIEAARAWVRGELEAGQAREAAFAAHSAARDCEHDAARAAARGPVTLPRPLTSLTTPVGLPLTPSPPPPTQRTQHPPLLRRQPNAQLAGSTASREPSGSSAPRPRSRLMDKELSWGLAGLDGSASIAKRR